MLITNWCGMPDYRQCQVRLPIEACQEEKHARESNRERLRPNIEVVGRGGQTSCVRSQFWRETSGPLPTRMGDSP